eukprot:1738369-Ditylum_brightwellii.AAC.1
MIQILLQVLIGSNPDTITGKKGNFRTPVALRCTDEEQGCKTLHTHFPIWIKDFDCTKSFLYHENENVRKQALSEIQKYIDKIMCTSYGNVTDEHTCNSRTMHSTPDRILPDPRQKLLHDMHHEDCCYLIKGIIGKCTQHKFKFTTQNIVNNALNKWENMSTRENHA